MVDEVVVVVGTDEEVVIVVIGIALVVVIVFSGADAGLLKVLMMTCVGVSSRCGK
jgi:hypothetical protein